MKRATIKDVARHAGRVGVRRLPGVLGRQREGVEEGEDPSGCEGAGISALGGGTKPRTPAVPCGHARHRPDARRLRLPVPRASGRGPRRYRAPSHRGARQQAGRGIGGRVPGDRRPIGRRRDLRRDDAAGGVPGLRTRGTARHPGRPGAGRATGRFGGRGQCGRRTASRRPVRAHGMQASHLLRLGPGELLRPGALHRLQLPSGGAGRSPARMACRGAGGRLDLRGGLANAVRSGPARRGVLRHRQARLRRHRGGPAPCDCRFLRTCP